MPHLCVAGLGLLGRRLRLTFARRLASSSSHRAKSVFSDVVAMLQRVVPDSRRTAQDKEEVVWVEFNRVDGRSREVALFFFLVMPRPAPSLALIPPAPAPHPTPQPSSS